MKSGRKPPLCPDRVFGIGPWDGLFREYSERQAGRRGFYCDDADHPGFPCWAPGWRRRILMTWPNWISWTGTCRPFQKSYTGMTYWLGTDDQGRDMLSAIIYGLRTSLWVGVLSGVLAFFIGSTLGLLAAYYGGRFRRPDNARCGSSAKLSGHAGGPAFIGRIGAGRGQDHHRPGGGSMVLLCSRGQGIGPEREEQGVCGGGQGT